MESILSLADDSYFTKSNKLITDLIKDMEKPLEGITEWLKQQGLKVDQAKD
jgi:hypothetical protein